MEEINTEESIRRIAVPVVLRYKFGGQEVEREGIEVKKLGSRIGISDFFKRHEGYNEIYVRTSSGNIYRIDKYGEIINGRETSKTGAVVSYEFPTDEFTAATLTIGQPFGFGNGRRTTPIVEIVAAVDTVRRDVRELSGGRLRLNAILNEFQKAVVIAAGLDPFLSPSARVTARMRRVVRGA